MDVPFIKYGNTLNEVKNNIKYFDDFSDSLSGEVVTKIEYIKRMLRSAIDNEDWTKVKNSINFIDSMMKS